MSQKFEKQYKKRINSLIALLGSIFFELRGQQLLNKLKPETQRLMERHIKSWDAYQSRIRNRRYKVQLTRTHIALKQKTKKGKIAGKAAKQ